MINQELYPMIYKRKSFHLFRNIGSEKITQEEIKEIEDAYQHFDCLCEDIKTKIKIVRASETSVKRGEEYCILLYSEHKENYLSNIGYLGEQLDLYLTKKNIGTLWFGMGKPNEQEYENFEYVIMIAIAKIDEEAKFRKDMFKSKRKEVKEFWNGDPMRGVSDIVRFAPSACNSQPWFVEHKEDELLVYRRKGKRGIMPVKKLPFYNQIDIGIFLCVLELCLQQEGIHFQRELHVDTKLDEALIANYHLK